MKKAIAIYAIVVYLIFLHAYISQGAAIAGGRSFSMPPPARVSPPSVVSPTKIITVPTPAAPAKPSNPTWQKPASSSWPVKTPVRHHYNGPGSSFMPIWLLVMLGNNNDKDDDDDN